VALRDTFAAACTGPSELVCHVAQCVCKHTAVDRGGLVEGGWLRSARAVIEGQRAGAVASAAVGGVESQLDLVGLVGVAPSLDKHTVAVRQTEVVATQHVQARCDRGAVLQAWLELNEQTARQMSRWTWRTVSSY
jgi:hypothetical protein